MEKTNLAIQLCALQLPLVWGDKAAALTLLEQHLSKIAPTSGTSAIKKPTIIVLPEAFVTGYVSPRGDFDLRPFAEPLHGPSHQKLAELAKRFQVAIAAPLIEADGGKFFNSMLFIDETGTTLGHYRKRHPWLPEKWATPGDLGTPVFSWAGVSITMSICFDLHFLRRECINELQRAELLLFSSVWVEEEDDTRTPQLIKTAKMFQTTIINANWAKSKPRVPSQGGSVIVSSSGEILARASDDTQQAVSYLLGPS
jgi:predicted amidohydrolase